jgi:hypothetical protein
MSLHIERYSDVDFTGGLKKSGGYRERERNIKVNRELEFVLDSVCMWVRWS